MKKLLTNCCTVTRTSRKPCAISGSVSPRIRSFRSTRRLLRCCMLPLPSSAGLPRTRHCWMSAVELAQLVCTLFGYTFFQGKDIQISSEELFSVSLILTIAMSISKRNVSREIFHTGSRFQTKKQCAKYGNLSYDTTLEALGLTSV